MSYKHKATFLSNTESTLPNLISSKRILDEIPLDDYLLLTFKTRKPYTIDEVMDMFENGAHLYILYDYEVNNNIRNMESCCAFCHPKEDQMYKFNVSTNPNGEITVVYVSIYYSLEILAAAMARELQYHKDHGGHFRVAMDEADIYRISLLKHK